MKRLPSEPKRLLELRPKDDPANLAQLVHSATRAPAEPLPNLKGRIRCSLRMKSARRRRNLRAALLGGVVLLTGSVVAAVAQPILHLWQERKIDSVAMINPSPPAARPRHRRASPPPSRVVDQDLLSPVEPADLPSLPPGLAPATPLPGLTEPSAVRPELTGEQVVPASPRAEPTVARLKPSPPRAPVALPASAIAPSSPSASPALARATSNRDPLRTAMLDPPSRQRWSPPASPSMPVAAPSASGSAEPFAPRPSASPSRISVALPPTAPGSISPPAAPTVTTSTAAASKPFVAAPPGEQALLSRAVRSLRSEHRPGSALAVLDEYGARFPSGSLRPEATRLRTEALLTLGHKPAALAELNRELAPGGAGSEESRLVRGELRAAAGRWQEALEDFDTVVRAHEPSARPAASARVRERFERALWGRASARSHLGDEAGARADLREYLRRFPQGRFASQSARLLGEQP